MSPKLHALFAAVGKRNDIVLAIFIVAIIFMMILPMPTFLVDVLIALNISTAVILLMMAVYIKTPLEFSSFPAVLLVTTLFRLALSITTTRLILLQADAGDIVYTFGNFVVGGNLVVGAVIFLILTIVNFLVITKGSERVAEVSARFSLDSMPGKQMSIDGDMRAGTIDMKQAQTRRSNVERESQLYGSMDGAMKFVKGDAIAGLIITFVNILGGVAIGMSQKGLSAGEALEVYSILTIGDGLVAQIPAIFISITAGFIVTRVASENSVNLGGDIGSQIVGHPKALMIGGALLLLFALIPGFPTLTFISMSLIFGGTGFYLHKFRGNDEEGGKGSGLPASRSSSVNTPDSSNPEDEFIITAPLTVDVDASLKDKLNLSRLNDDLILTRKALYMDLGVPFPGVNLRYNENVTGGKYLILLNEVPVAEGKMPVNHVLVQEDPDQLSLLGVTYEQKEQVFPGTPLWVDKNQITALDHAAVPYMDESRALCYHLSHVLRRYAEDFVGIQETRHLLEQMESGYSELVKEVQRLLPLQKLTDIFQRLVSEDISIRNLRSILEALSEWAQKEKDTVLLVEYVRGALKHYISYKYSNGQNTLPSYLLDQDTEEKIRAGIRQTSSGAYLALDPTVTRQFVDSISSEIGDINKAKSKPVLIVSMDIRRYVKKLVEQEAPDLAVLSFQELTRDINIHPLSRITA